MVFVSSWNKEKIVTKTVTPDQLAIPFNKLELPRLALETGFA